LRIRLTRKFAKSIDGIDLSRRAVGDVIDLPERDAHILIAEGWASPADSRVAPAARDEAPDAGRRSRKRRA
jgi:hypothetical protein